MPRLSWVFPVFLSAGGFASAQTASSSAADLLKRLDVISPTCVLAELKATDDNARTLADILNDPAGGLRVRSLDRRRALVCGDDSKGAVQAVVQAFKAGGRSTPLAGPRESHLVRLFFNRDAKGIADLVAKAFPKLGIGALGTDTIVLGTADGSDAAAAKAAKRWIFELDVPRPELVMNVWSMQMSNRKPQILDTAATAIHNRVIEYNEDLQQALSQGHLYLSSLNQNTLAPQFRDYLQQRYVAGLNAADTTLGNCLNQYCLGFETLFLPQPMFSSIMLWVVGSSDPNIVTNLMNSMQNNTLPMTKLAAAFTQLRQPANLARARMAVADFLYHYKFTQLYPDDFEPNPNIARWMDTVAAPVIEALNEDVTQHMLRLQDYQPASPGTQFYSNGILTLATLGSVTSSAGVQTVNEFRLPKSIPAADFIKGVAAVGAAPALTGGVLAANLGGLTLDPPSVATIGRNLTLATTATSLPGASAAELNINLISQDEPGPVVKRGSTEKPDTRSRVAKHNLQTVVRVDSLKLFELSTFSAEMRRGGESIPIILPYLEMPIIGGLLRWPVRPDRIYHRSIVIVSAVIQPTAADLASVVRPQPDMARSLVTLDAKGESSGPESFRVVATRQDGAIVSETVNASCLDDVKFTSPGPDWKVKVYQEVNGCCRIPGAVAEQPCPVGVVAIHRLTSISPQALLAGSVPDFHKRKLHCIGREAHGEVCAVPPLHNLPSIQ